jgi:hypothetical protein
LARDLETPDLWSEIAKQKKIIEDSTSKAAGNTPFTIEETKVITTRLDNLFDDLVSTRQIIEGQEAKVREAFNYLKEAATRLGRKDWIFISLSIVQILQGFMLSNETRPIIIRAVAWIVQQITKPLLTQ